MKHLSRLGARAALALGLAGLLSGAAVPAALAAGTSPADTVAILGVGFWSSTPGVLLVDFQSTTPLTELDVTFTSAAHPDALNLTLADFSLQSGTTTAGTYALTSPVTDSALPFDTYDVTATAQDSGGGSTTAGSGGSMLIGWQIQPAISIAASSTTYSYDNPSITFTGTLSETDPDGTPVPAASLAGQTLVLSDQNDDSHSFTTGADGSYSYTLAHPQNGGGYAVSILGTLTTPWSGFGSDMVTVTAVQDPAADTAAASATQLNYGQPLTITGTASYNPGPGYVPLANSTVEIYAVNGTQASQGGAPAATGTTDSAGHYSVTFADKSGPTAFEVYAGGLPTGENGQVLSQAVATTAKVNLAMPVKFFSLTGSLSAWGQLTLKGCLAVGGTYSPPALPLQVQYAATAGAPWKVLATVKGHFSPTSCGSGGYVGELFTYQVPVAVASAFYRLAYPGSTTYMAGASAVLHESHIVTRITNFAISPHTVAANHDVTVTGRLWDWVNGWHPFARQKIWIFFHYQGAWYYFPAHPVTNSAGWFSGRFAVPVSAPWLAQYDGGGNYFGSYTSTISIRVS